MGLHTSSGTRRKPGSNTSRRGRERREGRRRLRCRRRQVEGLVSHHWQGDDLGLAIWMAILTKGFNGAEDGGRDGKSGVSSGGGMKLRMASGGRMRAGKIERRSGANGQESSGRRGGHLRRKEREAGSGAPRPRHRWQSPEVGAAAASRGTLELRGERDRERGGRREIRPYARPHEATCTVHDETVPCRCVVDQSQGRCVVDQSQGWGHSRHTKRHPMR